MMRVVHKKNIKKIGPERFFQGIVIQNELDHPHIAKVFDLYQDNDNYYLIYE